MDTYTCIIFIGLHCWLNVGIYLWLCILQALGIFLILPKLISNLGSWAVFYVGRYLEKQGCKCGQPTKGLDYYIIERHNAVLLLPWELDINEELTTRPMVSLWSDAVIPIGPSDPAKPFCCRPPLEQAAVLFELAEFTLKKHDIPCFIVLQQKGHEYLVAKCGSL